MDRKRSRSRRSAPELIGDDLLIEILLLLPASSLIRFRLVSKHWRSLIFDPYIYLRHTARSSRRPPSFILTTTTTTPRHFFFNPNPKLFLPFRFEHFPHTRIIQSSHGLLLLECRKSPCGKRTFVVYNPTTRQSRELPIHSEVSRLCLAFDPSISPYYKIFCLWNYQHYPWNDRYSPPPPPGIEVYNSESHTLEPRSFVTNETFPNGEIYKTLRRGIYCNNGIYWIRTNSRYSSFYLNLRTRSLERLPAITIPKRRHKEINKKYIMEWNGRVHCICMNLRAEFERFDLFLFELLEANSGWEEKYVDLSMISSTLSKINGKVALLGIVRGTKEEDWSILIHVPGRIIQCNFKNLSFKNSIKFKTSNFYHIYKHDVFDFYKEGELHFRRNYSYQFIESLARV